MGRPYNPKRLIKASGVHTFYIGQPEDPVTQAFEAYCLHTNQTFSESCRNMIVYFLVKHGLLKDCGVSKNVFLGIGEGELTARYFKYRKAAEVCRLEQLKAMSAKAKKKEMEKKADDEEDDAFDIIKPKKRR